MYTTRHFPTEPIPPEQYDDYLARGYFRMGQTIFTTRFLFFNYQLFTPVWTRLDLDRHQFTKRQRRILRRVRERFRIDLGPVEIDREREQLFQAYRKYRGRRGWVTLRQSLYDHKRTSVYNTWEVRIFDGDQIVAFSHFDLGATSAGSTAGIFDPELARHSLGYATMLLEMEFMQQRGMRYYYPGYVVPGHSPFDYKRRIGKLDAYRPNENSWTPLDELAYDDLDHRQVEQRLVDIADQLPKRHGAAQLMFNPSFDMSIQDGRNQVMNTIPYPAFLLLYPLTVILGLAYIVSYDPRKGTYRLGSYNVVGNVGSSHKPDQMPANVFTKVLTLDEIVLETTDEELMLRELKSWGSANLF